ncbi:MAG: N-acetylmuramoyl-L-alanine amidase [Clostridia bacterium]|nr:N-acetylmuramoyl-L-alanine amidase [Clostridia bacterium]
MKIITVNLKKGLDAARVLLKVTSFILVITLAVLLSSRYFSLNKTYVSALSELTDSKTIIIDAGHGGEDCGAIGVNGVYEKDLNLEISTVIGQMLTERGYAVIYTRTEDKLLYTDEENIKGIRKISDLKNRCKIGAEHPNSLFISIHMNSFSSPLYSGVHTYYSANNPSSYDLAKGVQSGVQKTLQPDNDRVIKRGENMYLLEHLENPAILIECGFLTNEEECELLCKKEYQKELSFAIVCAIIEYIEKT